MRYLGCVMFTLFLVFIQSLGLPCVPSFCVKSSLSVSLVFVSVTSQCVVVLVSVFCHLLFYCDSPSSHVCYRNFYLTTFIPDLSLLCSQLYPLPQSPFFIRCCCFHLLFIVGMLSRHPFMSPRSSVPGPRVIPSLGFSS